ncbi:MAG TPA: hypothetical protein VE913_24870, partial [Longimicrobium sp.]|nr:hypothetical protein [Longimicrobium sp.]
ASGGEGPPRARVRISPGATLWDAMTLRRRRARRIPREPPVLRIPMISPRHFVLVATLLTLGGCCCAGITAPLPERGPPEELRFSTSGYGGPSAILTLRGDTVMLLRAPWERGPGTAVDTVRAVPDARAWSDFWRVAEGAGVRRWRGRYMAEGVADGVGWGLRIVADGMTIESQGSNAYPDREGREHELRETPEYRAFVDALGALVGQPINGA